MSSQELTADVVTTRQQLQSYAQEWNELLAHSASDTIFLTWEWISAWLESVYPDGPLLVVAVRTRDGRLVGLAPFYRSDLRLLNLVKYRCLRVIGDCHSGAEYMDVIVREGFEQPAYEAIVAALRARRGLWDCIYVTNAAGWTGGQARLESHLGGLGHLHRRQRDFAAVELPANYEEYLGSLARRHRSNVKRQEKRLAAEHRINFRICRNETDRQELLDALFYLHRQRWESVGQEGSFVRRPPMERFYRCFSAEALKRGWLRILALEVDGSIQAVQYGYVYGKTFYSLQEGYDPQAIKGVGNVLRNRAIQTCIQEGLSEYDFLGEFSDHKRHWEARARQGADLLIGRKSLKNQLLFCKEVWPAGRYVRQGRPASEGRSHD